MYIGLGIRITKAYAFGVGPPVSDKLIAWLPGTNTDLTHKTESISGYDFLMANCPPDYQLDMDGNQALDMDGNPMWFTELTEGWECEYTAPASGQQGHTELLAIDDGTLYTGTTPNVLTPTILSNIANDQMFFCDNTNKGFVIYSEVLTGEELAEAVAYWVVGCT